MRRSIPLLIAVFFTAPLETAKAADPSVPSEAREEITTQARTFEAEQKKKPLALPEKPEIEVEEKEVAEEEAGPSFFVKKIKLQGNTVLSEKHFAKILPALENRKVTFGELRGLAQIITNEYRARGYATSRAYIPPQTVEDGTVTISILEGKIGKIFVQGNQYFKSSLYENAIRIDPRTFRYQDLEASLYFLNQKPDRKAKAYLIAGMEPTASDIILKVEEQNPLHAYYEVHNRGTKLTHWLRQAGHFEHNNLTGNGDALKFIFTGAEEAAFLGGSLQYEYPIEKTGTTLRFEDSYSNSLLVKHLKPSEIEGESSTVNPGLLQNFIRTPAFVLDGFMGLEIKDSKTDVNDLKFSYDRTRILKLGPEMMFQDALGRAFVSGHAHIGFPNFLGGLHGVDPQATRRGAGGEFIYYTASVTRVQRTAYQSFLILRADGQWTDDNLVSLEQFRAGGAYSVRGYPESDASGDVGYHAGAELNIPALFFPAQSRVPHFKKPWREALRFTGFVDAAKTFNHNRQNSTDVKDEFLLGVGVGLRVYLTDYISAQLDWAYPLGDDSSDEDRARIHFVVRVGF